MSSSHSLPLSYNQLITVFYEEHRHHTAVLSCDIKQISSRAVPVSLCSDQSPNVPIAGQGDGAPVKRALPVSSLVTGAGWLAALPVGNSSLDNQSITAHLSSVQTQIVSVWSAETGPAILPPQYIIFIFGSD